MKRVLELDGLRGIAAAGVVAFHWAPVYTFWMWSFVDLFFVLSGFLISRILLESFNAGSLSFRHFWIRRILRIWPVYYLTVFGVAAFLLLTKGSAILNAAYIGDFLRSLFFVQFTPLYVDKIGEPYAMFYFLPGLLHSWSVAVEEQFYLIWPVVLMLLLPRLGLRRLGWIFALLALLGPISRAYGLSPVLLLTRIDGLALGVLLAIIVTARSQAGVATTTPWMRVGYITACAIGLAGAMPYLIEGYTHGSGPLEFVSDPLLVSDFSLLYFGLIGLTLAWQGGWAIAVLRSRPLVYLGSISYAMYMFHFPILGFIAPRLEHIFTADFAWVATLITGLLLVGLPHLSRQFMERPILALKVKFPNKKQPRAAQT